MADDSARNRSDAATNQRPFDRMVHSGAHDRASARTQYSATQQTLFGRGKTLSPGLASEPQHEDQPHRDRGGTTYRCSHHCSSEHLASFSTPLRSAGPNCTNSTILMELPPESSTRYSLTSKVWA